MYSHSIDTSVVWAAMIGLELECDHRGYSLLLLLQEVGLTATQQESTLGELTGISNVWIGVSPVE